MRNTLLTALMLLAGIAPVSAQTKIGDGDSPVAPIQLKTPAGKAASTPTKPAAAVQASAPGAHTTVVTTSTPGVAPAGANKAPANNKAGAAKADLKAELPAAVDTGRGVLRRPAGNQGLSTSVNMGYSNPATPQTASMPGLGYAPGSVDPGRPMVLHTTNGINEVINVSSQFPNRIVTPFEQPKVLAPDDVEATIVGNGIYISVGDQGPHAIYVVDKTGRSSAAVSLTLVPQAIPPQTIIVEMDGIDKSAGGDAANTANKESSYEYSLRNLMRTIARDTTPPGYTEETLSVGAAVSNGVRATPRKRYSGSENDIFKYNLVNTSEAVVTLSEEAFATKGVRAVSFFPKVTLAPGEKTDVIILLDKGQ